MKIQCERCRTVFGAKDVKLAEQDIEIKGKALKLTYYKCTWCERKYTVKISDESTNHAQREYDRQSERLGNIRKKGKLPTEYQVQKMYLVAERLKKANDRLNKTYNGSFYQCGDAKERLELKLPVALSGKENDK